MSYIAGTILKRKKPFKDEESLVYNEVKVVGKSPNKEAESGSDKEWQGGAGTKITISPTSFGKVVDRPQGELERDYEIVSIPEEPIIAPPKTAQRTQSGPSPEQIFASEAAKNVKAPAAS